VATIASAGVTNVPLTAASWVTTPYINTAGWQTPDATVTNPVGGNLRGTKTTATGGTNWVLGIHSAATYNFQNTVLRYQWKLNGQGTWSGIYNGVDSDAGHLVARPFVTGAGGGGLIGVTSDTWLYVQIAFTPAGYDYRVSTTSYGNTNVFGATGAIAPSTWTALATAHPFFQIGDNYAAGAFFEVAALTIALPPALQSAASRKVHGLAGPFDLPLSLVAGNPTTEPRQGPDTTIVLTFDEPIISASIAVTEGTAVAGAPSFSGNDVIVPLTGVVDLQYVSVAATNVASAVNTGGSGSVRLGFLLGDVSQNRVVTVSDLAQVNAVLAQPVGAANYLKDVNASGTLSVADKGFTNANLAKALLAP
jgi:hypothetical protein